jgi:hypothetical protein
MRPRMNRTRRLKRRTPGADERSSSAQPPGLVERIRRGHQPRLMAHAISLPRENHLPHLLGVAGNDTCSRSAYSHEVARFCADTLGLLDAIDSPAMDKRPDRTPPRAGTPGSPERRGKKPAVRQQGRQEY